MSKPKIIVILGSERADSHNARLAAVISRQLNELGADAQAVSLADYPMPIFNQDDEAEAGAPENARKLAALIGKNQGVVLVNPEYNGSSPA